MSHLEQWETKTSQSTDFQTSVKSVNIVKGYSVSITTSNSSGDFFCRYRLLGSAGDQDELADIDGSEIPVSTDTTIVFNVHDNFWRWTQLYVEFFSGSADFDIKLNK